LRFRLRYSIAIWITHALAWRAVGVEEGLAKVWKRVAYATRYGKGCGLEEALNLDGYQLNGYLEALGTLVEEENAANKARR
jgi:hypothetical protein